MSVGRRLAVLAVALSALTPPSARALDEYQRASSRGPTELGLCGKGGALVSSGACKTTDFNALTRKIEKALQASLTKAPANIRPLLKRDQVWFNEMMANAAESMVEDDETREAFVETLRNRNTTLKAIGAGFGRAGIAGSWVNAFGSIEVTPAEAGAYRLAIDSRAVYGTGSDRRRECKVVATVQPSPDGWLTGIILPEEAKPAPASTDGKATDAKSPPAKPPSIKIRRQGETLRVVLGDTEWRDEERVNCEYMWQITASYFAGGKADAANDKANIAFVAPTFDCTRPESASEEEICADPDMAAGDLRLNRAWKALLPRLDEATRRALIEDQRNWVRSRTSQYPEFLHPAWEKQTSYMHFTTNGRDRLDRLQRERLALLDGFDDRRAGLAGVWLAYNAVIEVTANADGSLSAKGWKWDQGDWKAGCDYAMKGKLIGGSFRSEESRRNPDTLERDHAVLVVNRLDDVFAKKRWKKDGTEDETADDAKCKRNLSISSTARLFPARPSPDIDNLGGGSIR